MVQLQGRHGAFRIDLAVVLAAGGQLGAQADPFGLERRSGGEQGDMRGREQAPGLKYSFMGLLWVVPIL